MNLDKMGDHLAIDRYGAFRLTDAIRPSMNVPIVPREGYRKEQFRDAHTRQRVPMIVAAVSAERLFDVFLELLEPLGEVVDVVLESSHNSQVGQHDDHLREQIDRPVLTSTLYDFEDLLLNDGCTGVAVVDSGRPMEVQFDEHKLLIVYARDLRPFERILREQRIPCDPALRLLIEAEHIHSTGDQHAEQFEQLCCRLAVGEPVEWAP